MTKEELKQEAEEKCVCTDGAMRIMYRIGYIAGAEPREKRIAELEAQIEKMKRCSVCKHSTDLGYCKIRCNGGECNEMDKWELKEND